MAGIEGYKRPGKNEAAFNAGISGGAGQQPGRGERDSQRTHQSAENRILSLVNTVQRQDGEPIDPYRISYALMDYQDQAYATRRGLILLPKPGESYQTVEHTREPAEEDHAFLQTIRRVRDAFDIIAFPHFPPNYQQAVSSDVYDEDIDDNFRAPDKSITLTDAEKSILGRLTSLADIPDDPQQRTYSYGSIPHIVDAKYKY